jgi:hypothetical protein
MLPLVLVVVTLLLTGMHLKFFMRTEVVTAVLLVQVLLVVLVVVVEIPAPAAVDNSRANQATLEPMDMVIMEALDSVLLTLTWLVAAVAAQMLMVVMPLDILEEVMVVMVEHIPLTFLVHPLHMLVAAVDLLVILLTSAVHLLVDQEEQEAAVEVMPAVDQLEPLEPMDLVVEAVAAGTAVAVESLLLKDLF